MVCYRISGLQTVPLTMSEGNIWGAAVLDYAYHSFSHLGIYYGKIVNSSSMPAR
jgi:hypothetical protein